MIRRLLGPGRGLAWGCGVAAVAMGAAARTTIAQWPQWGGPNRDFKADCLGLASGWPQEGPRRVWSRELGEGYSAISVDDGALYTMYRRGDEEVVICLDAGTGKTLWEYAYSHSAPTKSMKEFGPGPHSTPLVAGDQVYAVGVTGLVHCLNKKSGQLAWSHDLVKEFGHEVMDRGYSASPIAYKDTVILPVGGTEHAVVAFKQADGSVAWKSQDFQCSHASPILIRLDGQDQLVCFMTKEIAGLNPADGALLWTHTHPTQWGANISTPVWGQGNLLFMSSAYDQGSRVIQLSRNGDKTQVQELWYARKLRIHHGNAVRVGDYVYGSSGDFGPALLMAVDVRTGKVAWRERGFAKANLVYGDGKLIILDEGGRLALATATPDKLEVHAKVELLKRNAWTVPTLAGTRLYVRDRKTIQALDLS